jgi:hypothetical protein
MSEVMEIKRSANKVPDAEQEKLTDHPRTITKFDGQ